jgi:hypothetical protein
MSLNTINYLNLLSDLYLQQKHIQPPSHEEILHHINTQNILHPEIKLTIYNISNGISSDGWVHRRMQNDGTLIFMYIGHSVNITHDLCIQSVKKSELLIRRLEYIEVILHIAEHGCTFESDFLQNEYNILAKLTTLTYNSYIPMKPQRLRRSYNIDSYQIEIDHVLLEGWLNRRICAFDIDINIIKFNKKIYVAYFSNGVIEYVSDYWSKIKVD